MSLMACHLGDRNIALFSINITGCGVMEDKLKKLLMQDIVVDTFHSTAFGEQEW